MSMPSPNEQPTRPHMTAPRVIAFPTEARVPETKRHLKIRTALYAVLEQEFRNRARIGSEQFVYWDPTDPSACLAPDVFVRLGAPDDLFDSWKVWERGAPHLAVEIVSESDMSDAGWAPKLDKYHRLGVQELVRFDPEGRTLRIWDYVEGDLVERLLVPGQPAECVLLNLFWVVVPDSGSEMMLRVARDPSGQDLLPTAEEARDAALERVRVLEEELAKRG